MAKDIRVRYAPSPTGLLHIGNARTALFNYLYARHHGGTFIIRIEDTDRKRHVEDGERSQLENLRWLGMDWDESPETHENYRQSERLELYQKYIDQLLAEGKAYKSYVTEEELAAERERQEAVGETPRYINEYLGMSEEEKAAYVAEREAAGVIPTVRLAVNESGIYKWHDMVKGDIEFEGGNIGGDWVIQKKDGYPTYNFAVVIDDHDMQISHVIRGDDHIANTPFSSSKTIVRRVTFRKQSLTLSLFLVGTLVGKMKSSLAKNSSSSLMKIVSASLQQLSTRRKWTG